MFENTKNERRIAVNAITITENNKREKVNTIFKNYSCEGQLSIFDMYSTEAPQLLQKGQDIFSVLCGEVRKEMVTGTFPLKNNRGYHTDKGVVWNYSLGVNVFLSKEQADFVARKNLELYETIAPSDMHIVELKAWKHVRNLDNRTLIAFYAILDDGKVYMKRFMTFQHIIDYGSVEKARKAVRKNFYDEHFYSHFPEPIEGFVPEFQTMYKCREDVDWDWAEASYSGIEKEEKWRTHRA